jgi:hypothetical protein
MAVTKNTLYLLPGMLRIPGSVFAFLGTAILFIRFYLGIKPAWLERNVFALYSAYLDVKYLTVIQNQLAEEIGGVFLLGGLYMIAFSKEKKETTATNTVRLNAFMISMWINGALMAFSLFFIYGLGFVFIMMISSLIFLVTYIITFRILIIKIDKKTIAYK